NTCMLWVAMRAPDHSEAFPLGKLWRFLPWSSTRATAACSRMSTRTKADVRQRLWFYEFTPRARFIEPGLDGKLLSAATVSTTLKHLRNFFLWLSRETGYRSRLNPNDAHYFNPSEQKPSQVNPTEARLYWPRFWLHA